MATFLPAGTENDKLRKMGRSGWYAKLTFSNRMEPPRKFSGWAFGTSYVKFSRRKRVRVKCFGTLRGWCCSCNLSSTSMSSRFCLISRYMVPRKLSGRDNWKINWLTMTRSPTVMVPCLLLDQDPRTKISPTAEDALSRQKHCRGECTRKDNILTGIQESQGSRDFHRRVLVRCKMLVVLGDFILFVVKMLLRPLISARL